LGVDCAFKAEVHVWGTYAVWDAVTGTVDAGEFFAVLVEAELDELGREIAGTEFFVGIAEKKPDAFERFDGCW
jgi:hypothetical protein